MYYDDDDVHERCREHVLNNMKGKEQETATRFNNKKRIAGIFLASTPFVLCVAVYFRAVIFSIWLLVKVSSSRFKASSLGCLSIYVFRIGIIAVVELLLYAKYEIF